MPNESLCASIGLPDNNRVGENQNIQNQTYYAKTWTALLGTVWHRKVFVCYLLIFVQEVQRGVEEVERTVFNNKTGESLQQVHVSLIS